MEERHWSERGESQYRQKCIEAKGEVCFFCNEQGIVVHHLDGDRDNGCIDNLLPTCRSCHARHMHGNGTDHGEWSDKLGNRTESREYNIHGVSSVEMHTPTPLIEGAKVHFDRLNLFYRSAYGEEIRSFNDFLQYLIHKGLIEQKKHPDCDVIKDMHDRLGYYHNSVEGMCETPGVKVSELTEGRGDKQYNTIL